MTKTKLLTLGLATVVIGVSLIGVTTATSDYIHEKTVNGIGTISICDPNDSTNCITMKDRNEGATSNDITSTDSYGYHYQRGNNHGFKPCLDNGGCETLYSGDIIGDTQIPCGGYSPSTPLESNIFRVGFNDYCQSRNDNLWGGANDSQNNNWGYPLSVQDAQNRQGPCNIGYHVPSIGEWNKVLEYRASENNLELYFDDEFGLGYYDDLDIVLTGINEDFKIPFAGGRDLGDAVVAGFGDSTRLWSSSPSFDDYEGAMVFSLGDGYQVYSSCWEYRSNAVSLRCFKDEPLIFSSNDTGGDSLITVNIAALNSGQNTCSGEDYIFPNISALPTVQTISLAKRFSCVFGNAAAKAVTLQLSGDLEDGNGNVISGENVKLSNPDWTATPTVLKNGNTYFSGETFLGNGQTLFNKVANKIGQAYGSGVEIKITIPAGTPDGLYEGTLVLTY